MIIYFNLPSDGDLPILENGVFSMLKNRLSYGTFPSWMMYIVALKLRMVAKFIYLDGSMKYVADLKVHEHPGVQT